MTTVCHTPSAVRPSYIIAVFLLGFYLGLLFGVGAFAAWLVARAFFRGKFRLLTGFGGGFFGLASWFTILLNHKEQYQRVVAFLAQYLSKNWAVFLTDSFICSVGAILFVTALGLTRRSSQKALQMLAGGLKGRSKEKTQPPTES